MCDIHAVVTRTGHEAVSVARQYGGSVASTNVSEVLQSEDVDAVVIATRHDTHTPLALEALHAGKHVFVEKPLAIEDDELRELEEFFADRGEEKTPLLVTGFNRRFAPDISLLRQQLEPRSGPVAISYVMNVGRVRTDSWVVTPEGGGRNIGEACHIYDLFTALTGSRVVDVSVDVARPTTAFYNHRDNFVATVTFADGSLATLTYVAMGSTQAPKERMELFCDGRTYSLQDYRGLTTADGSGVRRRKRKQDKGHRRILEAFLGCALRGGAWPIPLRDQIQATSVALRVESLLDGGMPTDAEG
jgi:predicted dehydrogenase